MARPKSIARKLIEEQCRKFPKTPSLTLAKKLYKESPEMFKDIEAARYFVRNVRGKSGDVNRKTSIDKSLFDKEERSRNPFNLPESYTQKANVWNLPKSIRRVGIMSDIHIPHHDNNAIQCAIDYFKENKVDAIYINGDMLDFYQLSFHEKDPRKINIATELELGREMLRYLRQEFPTQNIYFIPANHEMRMQRYLMVKAPELLDIQDFELDVLLRVREYGVEWIPYGSKCYMGKLLVEHGDKIKGSGGVNPARTLFTKLKRHALCSHFHRTTESTERVYDDEVIVNYSIGCLCDLEPSYLPVNNHNHGCAIIDVALNGHFSVQNKKIINGKIY
jgi:hypothetical protein